MTFNHYRFLLLLAFVGAFISFAAQAQQNNPILEVQNAYQHCITVNKRPHKILSLTRDLESGKSGPWRAKTVEQDSTESLTLWFEKNVIVYATLVGGEDYHLADRWCFRKTGSIAFVFSSRGIPSGLSGETKLYFDQSGNIIKKVQNATGPNGKKLNYDPALAAPRVFKTTKQLIKGLGLEQYLK